MSLILEFINYSLSLRFPIDTEKKYDIYQYIYNCMLGGRVYCANDPVSTIPRARIILKMLVQSKIFYY